MKQAPPPRGLVLLAFVAGGHLEAQAQYVGIGTTTPGTALEVAGGLTLTETTSPPLSGANPAYAVPANVRLVRLVRLVAAAAAPTGTVALTSAGPATGQHLTIFDATALAATLNCQPIAAGQTAGFVYSGGAWRVSAGPADNLGNHLAIQPLNLQGSALTGAGASVGWGGGRGRAGRRGPEPGQNGVGNNVLLGFQAGQRLVPSAFNAQEGSFNLLLGYRAGAETTTGRNNVLLGYQSGYTNTTGRDNVFSGYLSGYNNTTGVGNLFSGNQSGYSNITGARTSSTALPVPASMPRAAATNSAATWRATPTPLNRLL